MPDTKQYTLLSLDIIDCIATVTLHAPPVNALSQLMLKEISACFSEISQDEAKVVVLTGDYGFSAGANIRELLNQSPASNQDYFASLYQLFRQIENIPFPLIAAINRFAMGAGLELALCADIRVMDDDARIAAAGVNMGLVFGTQRLSRLAGYGRAKDIVLTGRQIDAQQAELMGIIEHRSPPGQALSKALILGKLISQKAPQSVQGAKKAITSGFDLPFEKGMELEFEFLEKMLYSDDFRQRAQAFLDKV
ncbi:MAG: enoyl-CoA hydratase/isomerase family protein [Syntrophomonas sp.]|uniref:enoyl-CoA hydratase/isomerase family protein n=1 Tax=Syntrophomonas sp. TaxID=2053627 RepID=UPI00263788C4|nr:enoyl-CoA hydratase/isomerase family protein [Syntrophomonas sp.]MDD2510576.1 enoyl-CoA hydratase/isomerase family protein [Syntrophomonas sp.]MDD4626303.1 enoyl-CoA hydratase/isomerase family protein [Syntrophomonas sp.]